MGYSYSAQNGTTQYGIIEIMVDTFDDLENVDTTNLAMGSYCLIIDTSSVYMLNSKKEWVEL